MVAVMSGGVRVTGWGEVLFCWPSDRTQERRRQETVLILKKTDFFFFFLISQTFETQLFLEDLVKKSCLKRLNILSTFLKTSGYDFVLKLKG